MIEGLKDRVVIVTGGAHGIGKAYCLGFAKAGARVVIADIDKAGADRAAGEIAQAVRESSADALHVDVSDETSTKNMAAHAVERFGRIDVLVNNAGVQPAGRMATVQPRHFELELRVNVLGPFWCSRAVQEQMQKQGSGAVINISSAAANMKGRSGHYGVTKIALEWMTAAFAEELREAGIACNALKPRGVIDTPGARFGRGGNVPQNADPREDFVEASVILATATPATLTGEALFEHEVLARFGRGATLAR